MTTLLISKKMEKEMIKGSCAVVRKAPPNWRNIEMYKATYEYPCTWEWWKDLKSINGNEFLLQIQEPTQCQDSESIKIIPGTKRTKKGDISPVIRIVQEIQIDPDNPVTQIKYSEETAAKYLAYLKHDLETTSKEKVEKLFRSRVNGLYSFVRNYVDRMVNDESGVKKKRMAIKNAERRVQKLKEELNFLKAKFEALHTDDVVAVLKKNKNQVPEDLMKELACGQNFGKDVVKKVIEHQTKNCKNLKRIIKENDGYINTHPVMSLDSYWE